MSAAAFILVVGHRPSLELEGGAASLLRQLGARVRLADLWDDFAEIVSRPTEAPCRALVVEAHDRPDLAALALRNVRKEERLRDVPALLAVPERQVARVEPSSGFDDFILFPYVPAELYARIRQLEWHKSEFAHEERQKVGRLVVDSAAHEVTVDGRRVVLTAKEFALLAFLAAHRGRVFSREQLLSRVWGARYEGGARTVDIHVRRLRAKFGDALPLETLRGAGYKLRTPDQVMDEEEPSADFPRARAATAPS